MTTRDAGMTTEQAAPVTQQRIADELRAERESLTPPAPSGLAKAINIYGP